MYKNDNRPLKVKALELAIKEIKAAKTKEQANKAFLKWKVFEDEPAFIAAIKEKQKEFKENGNNISKALKTNQSPGA